MRLKLWLAIALTMAVSLAYAAKPELPRDLAGQKIQQFAPSGIKSFALTVTKQSINHSEDIAFELYAPTACVFRLQSTATETGGLAHTAPANARLVRGINAATPFAVYSGCTNGQVQVQ